MLSSVSNHEQHADVSARCSYSLSAHFIMRQALKYLEFRRRAVITRKSNWTEEAERYHSEPHRAAAAWRAAFATGI